ncbi:MAG TPA: PLP-dependent transferase, partial [Planctomycetes bacterium]|nr:PLP-dependent transferase [Planctomycetota bacterium]
MALRPLLAEAEEKEERPPSLPAQGRGPPGPPRGASPAPPGPRGGEAPVLLAFRRAGLPLGPPGKGRRAPGKGPGETEADPGNPLGPPGLGGGDPGGHGEGDLPPLALANTPLTTEIPGRRGTFQGFCGLFSADPSPGGTDPMKKEELARLGLDSLTVHAGESPDPAFGAVAPPLYQTSTFAFDSPDQGAARFKGEEEGYIYTRLANPTIDRLEEKIAALEGGAGALACSTGMGAIATLYFSLLSAGDHVVATSSLYGPSRTLLEKQFSRFGVKSTWVDTADLDLVRNSILPETKLLYIETPANPTIRLTDIAACAEICREKGLLLAVDNTFASPILQKPLELGADI